MRISVFACLALALTVASSNAVAGNVVTIGDLADATSARVIAIALKTKAEAAHPHDNSATANGSVSGVPGALSLPGQARVPAGPSIIRVSTIGGRKFVVVRDVDGEVEDMPIDQTGSNGLTVRAHGNGTYDLIDARGAVLSNYGTDASGNSISGNGGAFLMPPSGRISAPPISPPPGRMP